MELNEEIISDKIELAVLHFRAKNYFRSLSLYNEIVQTLAGFTSSETMKIRKFHGLSPKPVVGILSHPKLATILDQRAATYEKLENDPKALKDAEKIVTIDPVNCKGYLRMGKLYLKAGKLVDAYKIYQRGVYIIEKAVEKHKIPVPEKLLKSLKEQYRDINRQLKDSKTKKKPPVESLTKSKSFSPGLQRRLDEMLPLKRTKSLPEQEPKRSRRTKEDPVSRFPREVVEIIFANVPIRSLLKCHLVCKEWYIELTSLPRLYRDQFVLKQQITAAEYFGGLKLMKKVLMFLHSKSIHGVRLSSTFNTTHLGRILENIVGDETLELRDLSIINRDFSFDLLLNKLDKCKWRLSTLAGISQLRLGFNSSVLYPKVLLKILPQLESLVIVTVDKIPNGTNTHLLPKNSDVFSSLILERVDEYKTLQSLSMINHPGLTKEHQKVRPSERTFNPAPPFIGTKFPSLTKLSIVTYDFADLEVDFGKFLGEVPLLTDLYLENNSELSFKSFLLVVRLNSPSFKLKKLTFREKTQPRACSLSEFEVEDFPCLYHLELLDLYGSSLSCRGLLKILTIANKEWNLSTLNIGNSSHVYFKNDKFTTGHEVLNFSQVFLLVPGIKHLFLNELDLDNLSTKLLHQDLTKITGYDNCQLKKLDLSYCRHIDGIGLMNLVNASYSQPPNAQIMRLEELHLDGLDINKETVNLLMKRELVKTIKYDPFKPKWRQYGVNSMVPELS